MIKTTLITAAAALLLGGLSPIGAQEADKPRERGERRAQFSPDERVAKLKESLAITDEQAAKLKTVFEAEREKMNALRSDTSLSHEDRRKKSRELMRSTFEDGVRPVLTPEQLAKWKEIRDQRGGPGRERGERPRRGGDNNAPKPPKPEDKPAEKPAEKPL